MAAAACDASVRLLRCCSGGALRQLRNSQSRGVGGKMQTTKGDFLLLPVSNFEIRLIRTAPLSSNKFGFQQFLSLLKCIWSGFCILVFLSDPGVPSPIFVSGCPSVSPRGCVDLTDMTLADEDTNSILTDNANRAIQGNVRKNYLLRKFI